MFKRCPLAKGIFVFALLASFSCSSSEKTNEENNTSPNSLKHSISIPPGTADIKAEIINCSGEQSNLICKIKILEVFSYGAEVSPLPPGIEIEVYIDKSLSDQASKKINEKIIFGRVSQTTAPEGKKYWTIVMFNK